MRSTVLVCAGLITVIIVFDCIAVLLFWPTPNLSLSRENLIAESLPLEPLEERRRFHLPPGFEAQLVAAEPDIRKPINISFDDRARLWVTSSVEYPLPADEGVVPRDEVTILADIGEDGRARTVTRFASGLNIPIGLISLPSDDLLVYNIPEMLRLVDTDGDGRADRRESVYSGFGFDDTHGMANGFTWGFDGWIYACHGSGNDSTVRGSDGAIVSMRSGNIFRFKPDGSHIEIFTSGQQNPFGLTLDPLGHLYSCDSQTWPIWQLIRYAYYPGFGKVHDGLGFAPPMMDFQHGSTAIAGIAYYAADHYPAPYRDTIFVGNVVTNRINHDRPEWIGSTAKAVPLPDFLVSDDPWFRPVDIKLGPDGALYIADFYNRIIGHAEVRLTHPGRDHERGRVWRIVYRGPDGRGTPAPRRATGVVPSTEDRILELGHPNLTVRLQAANALVKRGDRSVVEAVRATFAPETSPAQRIHALWVLERLRSLDSIILEAATRDRDRGVRVHSMRVLAERSEWSVHLRELALAGLKDQDPFVRRAAAEALGLHPASMNLQPLLEHYRSVPKEDTHLIHTTRIALRNQVSSTDSWTGLATSLSGRDARDLADFALGVPSKVAARHLLGCLRAWPDGVDLPDQYLRHIAHFGGKELTDELISFARRHRPEDLTHQAALVHAIQQGTLEAGGLPGSAHRDWASELARAMIATLQTKLIQSGVELAASLQLTEMHEDVAKIAAERTIPPPQRAAAIDAMVATAPRRSIDRLGVLLLDSSELPSIREAAARGLGGIDDDLARAQLLKGLSDGPSPVGQTIARMLARTHRGADILGTAIKSEKSAWLVLDPTVRKLLVQSGVTDDRLDWSVLAQKSIDSERRAIVDRRRTGYAKSWTDASRGEKIFQVRCAVCHQIRGVGATIGPQLDGIGKRGIDRLIEDILDPSNVIDPAYRTTNLALTDGRLLTGLVVREEGEMLFMAEREGKEFRVSKKQIDLRTLVQISPMPDDFTESLTESEFYHLMRFLMEK